MVTWLWFRRRLKRQMVPLQGKTGTAREQTLSYQSIAAVAKHQGAAVVVALRLTCVSKTALEAVAPRMHQVCTQCAIYSSARQFTMYSNLIIECYSNNCGMISFLIALK